MSINSCVSSKIVFYVFVLSLSLCAWLLYWFCEPTIEIANNLSHLLILTWSVILVYILPEYRKKTSIICFWFSIFTLNFAKYFFIKGDHWFWGSHYTFGLNTISLDNECLAVAYYITILIVIFFSYEIFNENCKKELFIEFINIDLKNNNRVNHCAAYFCKLFAIVVFFKYCLSGWKIITNGYLNSYLTNETSWSDNFVLNFFSGLYSCFFYSYIITLNKINLRDSNLILFIVLSFLSLLTGTRGGFLLNIIFIIYSIVKQDSSLPKNQRLIRIRSLLFLLLPLLMIFALLFKFDEIRLKEANESNKLYIELIGSFFLSQSNSGRLLPLSFEYKERIYEYLKPYEILLKPTLYFITGNIIIRRLKGVNYGQSKAFIRNYPSFHHVISFVCKENAYLQGHGLGSNYNAELLLSLGLIGCVIFNAFLGMVLFVFDRFWKYKFKYSFFIAALLPQIMYLPRGSISNLINNALYLGLKYLTIVTLIKFYYAFTKDRKLLFS